LVNRFYPNLSQINLNGYLEKSYEQSFLNNLSKTPKSKDQSLESLRCGLVDLYFLKVNKANQVSINNLFKKLSYPNQANLVIINNSDHSDLNK